MSTVLHMAARIKPVAPCLTTEDEAIEAATGIAAAVVDSTDPKDRILELIAQSGLLGVTVPTEFGGADISNAFLAEVLAILSQADDALGHIVRDHFRVLEALRLLATEDQKRHFSGRALAGELLSSAVIDELHLLSAITSEARDCPPLEAFEQLLHSAIDLGMARAAFADMVAALRDKPGERQSASDPAIVTRMGTIAVKIEAASAILERAGRKIDMAQISPSPQSFSDASLSVAAAKVLATEAALAATNGLFEIADSSTATPDLDFDRHWRNATANAIHDPIRWKQHAIGEFHLNGHI